MTMRQSRRDLLLGVAAILSAILPRANFAAAGETYTPSAVKAAFLYRFAGYVTWPASVAGHTFVIAVMGDADVASELQRILNGRQLNALPAQVRQISSLTDIDDAQMLYVGRAFAGDLASQLRSIAHRPVLVVTDSPDGLDAGGTVNFIVLDRRVRFEISLPAAERAGLRISSELLSVAARVQGDHPRSETACLPAERLGRAGQCADRLAALVFH
jgi:YfiR/HmsC-like